ncbi:hypothetical protein BDK51DRAFT_15452 [Blyttiomyces helicus]|uniref:Uncharacterized protein n=1 Tax=Blyttiomyces helicus TaxID=388810 RepID=A0A4V1ISN7_9FUNG|nr:hypothetical protein BDK51DRAFT_15452 [Blyttiomyces helicus]|eukprot:RKO94197.1 hypothetical protein BDK51DRAFT_15452 [Blyttiomyces helicus]
MQQPAATPFDDQYSFTAANPYLSRPESFLTNPLLHRDLTESILALEAAVQNDPTNGKAWLALGLRQQENENDSAAISAFRAALDADPEGAADAWLAISASYTNESRAADAYDALESWLRSSPAHRGSVERVEARTRGLSRHDAVTAMFLDAVRSAPGMEMDADIQVGLGVLFNVSEEYGKAVDCFEAALSKRPQDYMLWNKLGATLANSNQPDRAMDAYFNALSINPSYVRARYNLAVSCMQLGQHREAAEHLLGALAGQAASIDHSVWSMLKIIADGHLGRHDLALACERRDLSAFKGDFDF